MIRYAMALAAVGAVYAPAAADACKRSITTQVMAPMEWNTRRIEYSINEAGSDDMDLDELEVECALSFAPWAGEVCAELDFVYAGVTAHGADPIEEIGYDDINVIAFREEAEDWSFDSDVIAVTTVSFCEGVGGICDLAGEVIDADIEVNGFNFRFTITGDERRLRFDLRNTMTHEVGHLLGFDHSAVATATMFASAPPGETSKRELHEDDIECLCDVYASIYSERNPTVDDDWCAATPGRTGPSGWVVGLALLALIGGRSIRRAR